MSHAKPKFFPLGESALTVEFGKVIVEDLNRRAIALADHFQANPFPGFVETVPAYVSTTIFYDPGEVRRHFEQFETAFDVVRSLVENSLGSLDVNDIGDHRLIEIPVSFDSKSALDLAFVANAAGFSEDEVIDIFTTATYRVYMLGFLPGFAYMGKVDERLAMPRKDTPRLKLPKGSVGIAGPQTGIYSLESPGGWQIIGRTDFELFTPSGQSPTSLKAGDSVRFVAI